MMGVGEFGSIKFRHSKGYGVETWLEVCKGYAFLNLISESDFLNTISRLLGTNTMLNLT